MANPNEHVIAEEEFRLVDEVEATMSPNHDRILVRMVDGIDPTYVDEVADDLRQRTSVKNAAGVDKNYVEEPQVGHIGPADEGRVYPDRWRGVSVRSELRQSKGVITQTLAYGLVIRAEQLPEPELVADDRRLIRPHAITNTPTKDTQEYRYRGIDPEYVQDLADTIALSGGTIDVRTVRMQDGSHNIHILVDTVTWASFSAGNPDLSWKNNEGTEHEQIVEVWHGIANTDALAGLYTPTADYNVMQVNLTENFDGSISVRRIQYHEAEATGDFNQAMKAHGLYPGVVTRTIVLKEAFKTKPTPVAITGAVVEFRNDLRQDGLWNSRQVNETVSWPNTTPAYHLEGFDSNEGWDEGLTYIATGIPIGSAEAFVTALNATISIKAARWTDAGMGEAHVRYVQKALHAFVNTSPDLRWKDNEGTEHERIVEIWYGVPVTDPLTNLYTPTAGYNVMQVNQNATDDGRITIRRVQYKEADATADFNQAMKAHSINPGVITRTIVLKQGYKAEPAPVAIAGAVVEWRSDLRPDGLWNARQVNEAVSWPNTTPTYQVARFDGNSGWEESTTYIATGVPIASAQAIVVALKATKSIKSAGWQDGGAGEAVIQYTQKSVAIPINAETFRSNSTGNQTAMVIHTWYAVPENLINATYAIAAAYAGEAGDVGWVHKNHERAYHRDGTATIRATAWFPSGEGDGSFEDKTDLKRYSLISQRREWDWRDKWDWRETTYNVTYKHTEGAAYDTLNAAKAIQGSGISKVGRSTWRVITVTRIRDLQNFQFGSLDTNLNPPP